MMLGSSCWATCFTFLPLLAQGALLNSLQFGWEHPAFLADVAFSACCSGLGQLLIFATIARFGAVVFVIIMTIRQTISIVVSSILFLHPLRPIGLLGLLLTIGTIFARIVIRHRLQQKGWSGHFKLILILLFLLLHSDLLPWNHGWWYYFVILYYFYTFVPILFFQFELAACYPSHNMEIWLMGLSPNVGGGGVEEPHFTLYTYGA